MVKKKVETKNNLKEDVAKVKKETSKKQKLNNKKSTNKKPKLLRNNWAVCTMILAVLLIAIFMFNIFDSTKVVSKTEIENIITKFASLNELDIGDMDIAIKNGVYEVIVKTSTGDESYAPIYLTTNGEFLIYGNLINLDELFSLSESNQTEMNLSTEIQTFSDSGKEICYEDGKPIIRMYSSSSCGYCSWSKPIYQEVVNQYVNEGKIVAYLWEDMKKDLLSGIAIKDEEVNLFSEFSKGGVPVFVFGCKYYRLGAPYSKTTNGEQLEKQELINTIETLL
jgi:thiol-disulfide isomerase/thioredoxin